MNPDFKQNHESPSSRRKIPHRVIIYPKDIENITGRRNRTACSLLQNIRKATGKTRNQFVTIREFCVFTGIEEDLVKDFLCD
jgi:hypothetical protein